MPAATMTVGLRPRPRPRHGPALRRLPIPVVPLALSALLHGALAAAVVVGALLWKTSQPRTYVVNLVPAVPAVGTPEAPPRPQPATPPRPPEPTPPPARTAPERPVVREAPRRPATPERPVVRDLPDRTPTPELPPPAHRELPTREMPLREVTRPPERPAPPALTRPGVKETPALPTPAPPPRPVEPPPPAVASATPPTPAPAARVPAPLPPPPVGRPTGSPQGSGTLSLDVGDFPFAWYLRTIQTKITERWAPPPGSREGQRVVVVFEIGRDGRASNLTLEKPSGNAAYDLAALRAVADASPFPPLPAEFKEPLLRVHLGFHYTDRG
jgi:TonB family protein